ncbi:hypothetical protein NFD59_12535 (plasmid) [Staphylococcus epidermidis]|nr:hypothetical protein NFD59_07800 [Staphylococcus epidermidis]UTI11146.1 hypothetical protein NFD59_12535 [Staphylococcus epidermidis]
MQNNKKFLALIFSGALILGACDTKDVEDSTKKKKDPKTEVDDKGRVKGEKIEKALK